MTRSAPTPGKSGTNMAALFVIGSMRLLAWSVKSIFDRDLSRADPCRYIMDLNIG